ncbi:MAG: hypothetical protein BWX50_01295 [Euryarchaeota archaeon ADurb.Bin009]|nr:MAG: hypothetical protein BWX50_01295 [Euryarchaeota archaeon ADurb.Bin009]
MPSSMHDGATISAPLSAWETAILAIRASDGSFLRSGPSIVSPTMPQWPWSVYSQAQTSVATTICGRRSLIDLAARWTTPSAA